MLITTEQYSKTRMQSINNSYRIIKNLVCPIVEVDPYFKKAEVIGTSILMRKDEQNFLITASHVAEQINAGIKYLPGKTNLIEIKTRFYKTVAIDGNSENDKVDIAIGKLDKTIIDELNYEFIEWKKCSLNENVKRGNLYAFVGFPNSKNRYKNIVTPRPYGFTNPSVDDSIYEKYKYSKDIHILIEYEAKNSMDFNDKKQKFPKPHGISGGGVWRVMDNATVLGNSNYAILCGIIIEKTKDSKYWVGTKLNIVKEGLDKYPY